MARFKVVLDVDQLACVSTTFEPEIPIIGSNTRDEVYFFVTGDSSRGIFSRRLPRYDDYYEFTAGYTAVKSDFRTWTNQDQEGLGRPILWAGDLDNNEGANVFVVIAE